MTLHVRVEVKSGGYEAEVTQTNGNPTTVLAHGEGVDIWLHSGNQFSVKEVPPGTKAALVDARIAAFKGTAFSTAQVSATTAAPAPVVAEGDFKLGPACGILDGPCESCQ